MNNRRHIANIRKTFRAFKQSLLDLDDDFFRFGYERLPKEVFETMRDAITFFSENAENVIQQLISVLKKNEVIF